jgi:hypothetical protein
LNREVIPDVSMVMEHGDPQFTDDPNGKTQAPQGSRFDPVADFYDSKQHTLTQLTQRISELALSEEDTALLSRLTRDQLQCLRDNAEECFHALSALESAFVAACEEAEGVDADDEDDVDHAPGSSAMMRNDPEVAEAWHLLDSYGPTLAASEKDVEASRRAKKLISSVQMACWFNARRLIEVVDEFADAALVEGYAVSAEEGTYFEHGWVVHRGTIIDPTLPDKDYEYFPGLEFIGRESIAGFDRVSLQDSRRTREDPFFHAFGWGGQHSLHMKKANKAADARVQQIVNGNDS